MDRVAERESGGGAGASDHGVVLGLLELIACPRFLVKLIAFVLARSRRGHQPCANAQDALDVEAVAAALEGVERRVGEMPERHDRAALLEDRRHRAQDVLGWQLR